MPRRKLFSGAQLDGMWIDEACHCTHELELARLQLVNAIICKLLDDGIFACHHLGEVETDIVGMYTPGLGMADKMHNFGGVEERLGRHAASKNAHAPPFFSV